jgi:uncharacterized protein
MSEVIRALIIGTAGGCFCWLLGLPAPWLAGSLLAGAGGVLMGLKLDLPDGLRSAAFILLGIQTGTAVTPDTVERAARWPWSILAMGVTVAAIIWLCMGYFERVSGWDRRTALFAGMPGALSLVMLLSEQMQANMQKVVVSQCIRLFLLVVMLPAFIVLFAPPHQSLPMPLPISDAWRIMLLLVASTLAGLAFARLKVPAGLVLGSALAAAALSLTGTASGTPPDAILIPAYITLGLMIALRFRQVTPAELRSLFRDGLAGFAIALVIAMIGAALVSYLLDLPIALALLAFAPGGLEAMTIMAFALNLDPAYVAAHHIARYIGLVLFMPWIAAYVLKPKGQA